MSETQNFSDAQLLDILYDQGHPQFEVAINDFLMQCLTQGEEFLVKLDSRRLEGSSEVAEFLLWEINKLESKLREGNVWLQKYATGHHSTLALYALRASGGYLKSDFFTYLRRHNMLPIEFGTSSDEFGQGILENVQYMPSTYTSLRITPLGALTLPFGYGYCQLWPQLDTNWEPHQKIEAWGSGQYEGWVCLGELHLQSRQKICEQIEKLESIVAKHENAKLNHEEDIRKTEKKREKEPEKRESHNKTLDDLYDKVKKSRKLWQNHQSKVKSLETKKIIEPLSTPEICRIFGILDSNAYQLKLRWIFGLRNKSLALLEASGEEN